MQAQQLPTHDLKPLRITRVESWMERAREVDQEIEKFLFMWIGFNAAYGNVSPEISVFSEKDVFNNFIDRVVKNDKEGLLDQVLWNIFPNKVRVLMQNKYSCQFFWADQMSDNLKYDWRERMDRELVALNKAFSHRDTAKVLKIIFCRLYVLRNRIVHGGTIFENAYNQKILENASWLLESLINPMIEVMKGSEEGWGRPLYSVK